MSAPAFTPGPWRIRVVNRASGEPIGCNILYPEEAGKPDVAIASVYTPGRADARLIASAPELYEVLDIIIANAALGPDPTMNGSTDCYAVPIEDIETAQAALAKARGE